MFRASLVPLAVLLVGLPLGGCSDDDSPAADRVAPAQAAILTVQVHPTGVFLAWTAPGDDGNTGTAAEYEIRYSTGWITQENWDTGTLVRNVEAPEEAGTTQVAFVLDLAPGTLYFFSVRTADEAGNWSPISDPVSAVTIGDNPEDSHWWDGFGNESAPFGDVLALTVHDGELIVGGLFNHVGSMPADAVAAWNGTSWRALGNSSGLETVQALTSWNGNLIAAGRAAMAKGPERYMVASWDGSSWTPLGPATWIEADDEVRALAVFEGDLIAGGSFNLCAGGSCPNVARWDGDSWSLLSGGLDGPVRALLVHDGTLYAAGHIGAGTVGVAARDGSHWKPVGSGIEGTVTALTVFEGDLVAAGDICRSGGSASERVLRWNGSSWSGVGGSVPMTCLLSLGVHDGALIVGGMFGHQGATSCPSPFRMLSAWDGIAWRSPGSGLLSSTEDAGVAAIQAYDGDLYVGGVFLEAGGKPSICIARWR
ncbi:MAG: fibronectin type III domain-containing protein [Candidatus Eisenbacteria bacterium]|nr:fibronectin type III domain-containing protein [Candidatus Eisenbacteria bacterium]